MSEDIDETLKRDKLLLELMIHAYGIKRVFHSEIFKTKNNNQNLLNVQDYNDDLDKMIEIQNNTKSYENILEKYYDFDDEIMKKFEKYVNNSKSKDAKRFRNHVMDLTEKEFNEESYTLQNKYIYKNVHNFSNKLNEKMKDNGINVYYVNKKKKTK